MYGLDSFLLLGWLPPLLPSKAPTEPSQPGRSSLPMYPAHVGTQDCPSQGPSLATLPSLAVPPPALPPNSRKPDLTSFSSVTGTSAPSVLSSGGSRAAALLHRPQSCLLQSFFSEKHTRHAASGLPCSKRPLSSRPRGSRLGGPFPSGLSLCACSFSQGPFPSRHRGSAKLPLTEAGRPQGGWVLGSGAGRAEQPRGSRAAVPGCVRTAD